MEHRQEGPPVGRRVWLADRDPYPSRIDPRSKQVSTWAFEISRRFFVVEFPVTFHFGISVAFALTGRWRRGEHSGVPCGRGNGCQGLRAQRGEGGEGILHRGNIEGLGRVIIQVYCMLLIVGSVREGGHLGSDSSGCACPDAFVASFSSLVGMRSMPCLDRFDYFSISLCCCSCCMCKGVVFVYAYVIS